MKTRRLDADIDRDIITGMIVSTPFLKAVQDIYKPAFLMTPFSTRVAAWCIDYYKEYQSAPGKHIQDIFRANSGAGIDDATLDQIEVFLTSLSDQYEKADKFNVEYILDQTEKLFRRRALKLLVEDVEDRLVQGDMEEAETAVASFKLPERMKVMGKPFNDEEALQRAFESRAAPLFEIPGALGNLLNPHFVPGGFVAFLGKQKIGKTWLLMELKKWALHDHCSVAMFQLGDLTEGDYRIRQGVQFAGKSNDPRYCGPINIPLLDCIHNQRCTCPHGNPNAIAVADEKGTLLEDAMDQLGQHVVCKSSPNRRCKKFQGAVWWEKRGEVSPLTWKEASQAISIWERRHRIAGFKLSVHSNTSINVHGIENTLDLWNAQEGFVPNVIILDYPDIMKPEDGRVQDKREQENDRWKAMRKLSQERNALVIAVTQRNWENTDIETAGGMQVSEDKRKLSHVTAFFSLNQTAEEKENGLMRIAPIAEGIREGAGNPNQQVVVIQCLQIGKPVVDSYTTYKTANKKSGGWKK